MPFDAGRERLLFAQAVYEYGNSNWPRVCQLLNTHPLLQANNPDGLVFTPEDCAKLYLELMQESNIDFSVVGTAGSHAPEHLELARKFYQMHMISIRAKLEEDENRFRDIATEIDEIRAGQWDTRIKAELRTLSVQTDEASVRSQHTVPETTGLPRQENNDQDENNNMMDGDDRQGSEAIESASVNTPDDRSGTELFFGGDRKTESDERSPKPISSKETDGGLGITHTTEEEESKNQSREDKDITRESREGSIFILDSCAAKETPVNVDDGGPNNEEEISVLFTTNAEEARPEPTPLSEPVEIDTKAVDPSPDERVAPTKLGSREESPLSPVEAQQSVNLTPDLEIEHRQSPVQKQRKRIFSDINAPGVDQVRETKRAREESEPMEDEAPFRRGRHSTFAPPSAKNFKSVINLLHGQISQHRNGNIFHNPIKKSEAPDYYDIVKHPVDLKTIKARIKDNIITNSLQFQRDIYLMFMNAMMYNRPRSDIFKMAEEMLKDSERNIQSFRQTEGWRNA